MKLLSGSFATLAILVAVSLDTVNVNAASLETRAKQCTKSTDCNVAKQHFCNHGYCASAVANGQACYKDQGCLSGHCVSGKCASSTLSSLGASCSASSQCQSGYCGKSKCSSPVADGQYCYKDVGCVSKKCDLTMSKCIAATATATAAPSNTGTSTANTNTGTSTATTKASTSTATTKTSTAIANTTATTKTSAATATATYPVVTFPNVNVASPPAPTAALAKNGDFSDGKLAPFTASTSGSGSSAAVKKIDGNYVADLVIAKGGSVSLTQSLGSSSLSKRQNPSHWMLSAAATISSFTKAADSAAYASCKAIATIGGAGQTQSTVKLYEWVYEYAQQGAYGGWSTFSTKWATGPTQATISYVCDPGMSAEFYTDNYSLGPFLHQYPAYSIEDGSFESGSIAPEWSFANASGVTYGIKNDAANAHSGSRYLEATVDGGWWDFTYNFIAHPGYIDHEADTEWQDYTLSFWYNIVSLEDNTGSTQVRDGCELLSGDETNSQTFGAASSSGYMQVNDPTHTFPTGWQKATVKMPVEDGFVGSALWCKEWGKGVVRLDDFVLTVPRNETAS